MDGDIINNGPATTYIHNLTTVNAQHTYRVRAKTDKASTLWSGIVQGINWSQSEPGICIAQPSWATGINQNIEVVIKANNIADMYMSYIVLQYDPQVLEADTQSIASLVWPEETDVYTKYAVYWETGKVKLLVSRKGTLPGANGQFDIVKLNFKIKTEGTAQVSSGLVDLVNSAGEYLIIPEVRPLDIRLLIN